MKVYSQGHYRVPEQPTWPALPWRTDIPDLRYRPLHEYSRSGQMGGVEWAYCRTHRHWEAA